MSGEARQIWRSKLTFAYLDEPPFCFPCAGSQPSGCDVELAQIILAAIGVRDVQFVLATFADLLPGLTSGRWTMTTGMFVTPDRRRIVEFSRPIWALPDGFLVRKGNPRRLVSYAAVARDGTARLGIVRGQVQWDAALSAGVPVGRILVYETQDEAAAAVLRGEVDAYASVAMAHRGYIERLAVNTLACIDLGKEDSAEPPTPAFGAFAFGFSNDGLRDLVDQGLAAFLGSKDHRNLMQGYGFSDSEIDRVID